MAAAAAATAAKARAFAKKNPAMLRGFGLWAVLQLLVLHAAAVYRYRAQPPPIPPEDIPILLEEERELDRRIETIHEAIRAFNRSGGSSSSTSSDGRGETKTTKARVGDDFAVVAPVLEKIGVEREIVRRAARELLEGKEGDSTTTTKVVKGKKDSRELPLFSMGKKKAAAVEGDKGGGSTGDGDDDDASGPLLPHLTQFLPTLSDLATKYAALKALRGALKRVYMEIDRLDRADPNADGEVRGGRRQTMEAWQDFAISMDELYDDLAALDFAEQLRVCPSPDPTAAPAAAAEQDKEILESLEAKVKRLEEETVQAMEYYHDHEDWPVALESTSERIEEEFLAYVLKTVERIEETLGVAPKKVGDGDEEDLEEADDEDGHIDNCLRSIEQVLPWLDAGIDAIYRNEKDLRKVILSAIESDPSIEGTVILDAALPLGDDAVPPSAQRQTRAPPAPAARSLRQYLDGPLIKQVAVWIDQFVDYTSGYSDRLDQFWDNAIAKYAENGLLGPALVRRFMEFAGRIRVPTIPSFLSPRKKTKT